MKKLLPLLLIFCLLAGCGAETADNAAAETVSIYRIYTGRDSGDLLQPETLSLAGRRSSPETVLELFISPAQSPVLKAALPEGVSVLSCTQQEGLVTLELSDSFTALTSMEQSCAVFAAVLTFCSLEDVDAVSISCGGQLLFQGLNAEDALLQDTDSDPYTRRLRLYFADDSGRWLSSEYRSLSLDDDSSLERYVMEELLRGPNDTALHSAIPEGTQLLSCTTEDGVCTVNLSGEFLSRRPETAIGERLAIGSIVNSLTVLSDVDSVLILCEEQTIDRYVYRDLSQPLPSMKSAIGPANSAKGETEVILYAALPELDSIAAMPCVISAESYDSMTDAVLDALCQSAEPGLPQLFCGSGTVSSAVMRSGVCTVELSDSFFASLSADERSAAVQCLAAALLSLDDCRAVQLKINGENAVFEGVSYAGPWTAQDINIVE